MFPKQIIQCIPANLFDSNPINVCTSEVISCTDGDILHCHDCVSILYIQKPYVKVHLSSQNVITPQAGDFVFLLPGPPHSLLRKNPAGYHTDIYIAQKFFYQNIFPRLCDNPVFMNFFFTHMMPDKEQPHKLIHTANDPYVQEKMVEIYKEYQRGDHLSQSIIASEVIILLAYLARLYDEESTQTRYKYATAEQIVAYIGTHFLTTNLNDVAWHFHYTNNYVCEMLRTETGKRFTEWLHYFRVNHALTLLDNTSLPIHIIATSCGFETPKYFYRVFKKHTGMTPTEYREAHQNNLLNTLSLPAPDTPDCSSRK